MSRPFPTLAYFCAWNRSLSVPDQRDEHGEEDAGLLYFGTKLDLSPFKRARKLGLAQGLVDFTRMLSTPKENIKAVHSSKQRMLFFEPEEGYYLHAVIDLARMPNLDKGHSRQSSAASDHSGRPQSPTVAIDEGLEDETLLAGLKAIYEDFKLFNGTFAALLAEHGREGFSGRLKTYFDTALWRWQLERCVLGVGDFRDTLGALSSAEASVSALPALAQLSDPRLLLHYDQVLHASFSPPLTPLARHILRSQSRRPTTKPPDKSAKPKEPKAAASTASKWTLGLSDYLTPSHPSSAPSNTSSSPANGRSWLRAVSWGSATAKVKEAEAKEEPKEEGQVDEATSDASSESEIAEHIARIAFPPDSPRPLTSEIAEEAVEEESEAPAVESPEEESPFEPPLRVFLGAEWRSAHCLKRSPLALVVIADTPPPAQQAYEILDAVTTALNSTQIVCAAGPSSSPCTLVISHSPSTSTFRHLHHSLPRSLSLSQEWPGAEEGWSGGKRSGKESDVLGVFIDFLSDPTMEETLVRTGSGQWAAARRAEEKASFLVLPRRFGKEVAEGSLLDASHELAKVAQEADRLTL